MAEPRSLFLRLPLELREHIYSYYFRPADRLDVSNFAGGLYRFEFDLLRVNKQVHLEAHNLWRRKFAYFVRLQTLWPNAVHHISNEGLVPIVAYGPRASNFKEHAFLLEVSSHQDPDQSEHPMIMLLDDIPQFAQTWFYSGLTYPGLNEALNLKCTARNLEQRGTSSNILEDDEKSTIPLDMQKRLLLPFGKIKGLSGTQLAHFDKSVEDDLLTAMAAPYPPVHECFEECITLIEKGDELLSITPRTIGTARSALESFFAAFHAMHILIDGRKRRVLADAYFHENITEGRFKGQMGSAIRIILRIRLVSRCVLAYLRMGEYGEAAFWGMRSVRIMSEQMSSEFDAFIADYIGSEDMGMINARTAIAFTMLESGAHEFGSKYAGIPGNERREEWAEELESYESEFPVNSEQLWVHTGRYLNSAAHKETRETVINEAKDFGVEIPEFIL
ncbi:unnamed protein product [Periconia digitata]|uniref:Uncharacterized protein n=1 Tax=Periconia digitata TaxID=1303443 RepID=A0A9W4XKC3_9PLEO|nr:unnamed protein product [Periconia digitata]